MHRRGLVMFLLALVSAVVLAAVPFFDQEYLASLSDARFLAFASWIRDKRLQLVIVAAAVNVTVIAAGPLVLSPARTRRLIRDSILRDMLRDLFGGDKVRVRITILRDAGRCRALRYFLRLAVTYIMSLLPGRLRAVRPSVGLAFLYVAQRVGTEYPKSRTFFYYSPHTSAQCDGIAAFARKTEESQLVTALPDLSRVDFRQINKRRPDEIPPIIRTYMRETKTSWQTLQRLNVLARHFLAEVLYDREGRPTAVLMIDSTQPESPFSSEVESQVKNYVRSLSYHLP
jgi:hypothetical protein